MIQWLYKYFFVHAVYHCKPLSRNHHWRGPKDDEKYPVCTHCGKHCWWLRGYRLRSGKLLAPDPAAQAVARNERLVDVPYIM